MSTDRVLVSIITVCFNEVETISRCVESVLQQTYEHIQYIVVDGASSDGTVELLEGYRNRIDTLISESDEGIYFAMNKALDHCSGDVVYFLNADDYFFSDDVVQKAVSMFSNYPSIDVLSGRVAFFNTPYRDGRRYTRTDFSYRNKQDLYRRPIPQQCVFVKSKLFELHGGFDQRYAICADYEWLIRMMRRKARIKQVEDYFCHFDYTGVSYTQNRQRKREKNRIILANSSLFELFHYGFFGVLGKLRGLFDER